MQQTQTAVGAHLVGGLQAADAESAMRAASQILGRYLYAITMVRPGTEVSGSGGRSTS
jgi:hypothetical protein